MGQQKEFPKNYQNAEAQEDRNAVYVGKNLQSLFTETNLFPVLIFVWCERCVSSCGIYGVYFNSQNANTSNRSIPITGQHLQMMSRASHY